MAEKPIIAITMGDPCGIGAEVIAKALARPEVAEFITRLFPFYGEQDRVSAEQDRLLDAVWQGIRAVRAGETAGNVDVLESWLERADLPTDLRVGAAPRSLP